MRDIPLTFIRGFAMGSADVVPGVSGGTVALVLGFYRRLVEAIRGASSALGHFAKLDVAGGIERFRAVDWTFVISLLAGIGAAVVTLAHLIEGLLESNPVEMAGLFLGLVGGSAVIAWKLLERRDGTRAAVMLVTAVAFFFLLGLRESTSTDSANGMSDPSLLMFFVAGAIAICAMILPGISGSFLLVSMGMYAAVLGTVTDRDLLPFALFLVGCVVGLGVFSQLLHWALEHHYDNVMAGMIGLMLGSLRVLWPWPGGVESTELAGPTGPVLVPVLLAVVGFVVVIAIERISERLEHRTVDDEIEDLRA